MKDFTPLYHAISAIAMQLIIGALTGNFWAGAAFGAAFYIGREHTQAEYRWIKLFGEGKRANMPWWGGFDKKAWDTGSVLDFVAPIVGVIAVGLAIQFLL